MHLKTKILRRCLRHRKGPESPRESAPQQALGLWPYTSEPQAHPSSSTAICISSKVPSGGQTRRGFCALGWGPGRCCPWGCPKRPRPFTTGLAISKSTREPSSDAAFSPSPAGPRLLTLLESQNLQHPKPALRRWGSERDEMAQVGEAGRVQALFTRDSVMGQVGCLEKAAPPPIPTASSSAEYGGPEPGFLGEAPRPQDIFSSSLGSTH